MEGSSNWQQRPTLNPLELERGSIGGLRESFFVRHSVPVFHFRRWGHSMRGWGVEVRGKTASKWGLDGVVSCRHLSAALGFFGDDLPKPPHSVGSGTSIPRRTTHGPPVMEHKITRGHRIPLDRLNVVPCAAVLLIDMSGHNSIRDGFRLRWLVGYRSRQRAGSRSRAACAVCLRKVDRSIDRRALPSIRLHSCSIRS